MTLPARIRREPRLGMPERIRSPGHLAWVRKHGCCVPGCREQNIEAHHVHGGDLSAKSVKPGDNWAISLCGGHHHQIHHKGAITFEKFHGISLLGLAREFAQRSPFKRKLLPPTPERR